jgi:hypothetical protein
VSIDAGVLLEHVQVIKSKIGRELIKAVFSNTAIFFILIVAFSRHIIKIVDLFD